MKAVVVRQWGGAEFAVIEEIDQPQPGPGEILIRVKAASINQSDWKTREGYMRDYVPLPITLGSDFAGDIEAVGEGVEEWQVGTAVYGMKGLRGGSFADYTTVLSHEIAAKPETLTYLEAAAVPHTALTAWKALFVETSLQAGQRVLVHAAAGGVGHFAVQFAKLHGTYVIATASAQNEAFLRELGVDELIDYTTTPFESVVKDVDIVVDTLGFDVATRSLDVLKPGGTIVGIVSPAPFDVAAERGLNVKFFGTVPDTQSLTEIAQLIDAGKVKPYLHEIFEFDRIHDALQVSQGQHARGKLVVNITA